MQASRPTSPLDGRVVIVTGASSGIGRALALKLGKSGYSLGLLARREQKLQEVKSEIIAHLQSEQPEADPSELDARIQVISGDVTNAAYCERAINTVVDQFGQIDCLINNAGVSMNGRFDEVDLAVFEQMMAVNYFGSLYMTHFAWQHLKEHNGSVLFISSIVGKRGFPTRSGYAAAKFAVQGLFESLRAESIGTGIHVGMVSPGYTATEIRFRALGEDGKPRMAEGHTMGDVMQPDDVADAIIKAMDARRREVVLTIGGKAMMWLNRLWPSLADRIAARVMS